ncbi:MAG: uroporphyrinogen decarboxylase [Spirochaetota bacterium]|nr:uroporphyrinogen decarboxylase [Spirochaetota bacterium]
MSNNRFIQAAFCKKTDRVPVWLMRQAGRYMKEYQALRSKYSFLELCKIPEQATKVTMLPVDLLDVDAAILFSDILIPIEAMGLSLDFTEKGPQFANPVRNNSDLKRLSIPNPEEKVPFVMETIRFVKKELNGKIPLIGFSGAPFTLMSYMVEGKGSADLKVTKQMLYQNPELAHNILEKTTQTTINYLNAQIQAGAEAIQIFDTWAGLLAYDDFINFSLKYIQKVISGLNRENIPIIIFAKGSGVFYRELLTTGADVISLDWSANIVKIKQEYGNNKAVQGNLDPYSLYVDQTSIRRNVKRLLDSMKSFDGYIFNLGHGILQDIPFDNVRYLVDCVKELGVYDRN